jgi:hypothetical protein
MAHMIVKDLAGLRVGRLVVLRRIESYVQPDGRRRGRWLCRCDCGREFTALTNNLGSGSKVRSCGCLKQEADITAGHRLAAARMTVLNRERDARLAGVTLKPAAATRSDRKKAQRERENGPPPKAWTGAQEASAALAALFGYATGASDD